MAENPRNFLLDNKAKLVEIFPELKSSFDMIDGACVSCKRQFILRTVVQQINRRIRKGVPAEFSALNPPGVFFSESSKHQRIDPETVLRESCIDCVRKHLAQASVLLREVEQGYTPEKGHPHFWLAVGHLAEASDEAVKEDPLLANRIRAVRLKLMGQVQNESGSN